MGANCRSFPLGEREVFVFVVTNPAPPSVRGGGSNWPSVVKFPRVLPGTTVNAKELREQVKELLALAADVPDREGKRRLASRAFALAQHAEMIERVAEDSLKAPLDPNFYVVTEANIVRFVGELYVQNDAKIRALYRGLTLKQESLFGARQERLTLLMRLLHDCDGRISQTSQRSASVPTEGAERLLDNLIDTQRFLLQSFCDELVSEV